MIYYFWSSATCTPLVLNILITVLCLVVLYSFHAIHYYCSLPLFLSLPLCFFLCLCLSLSLCLCVCLCLSVCLSHTNARTIYICKKQNKAVCGSWAPHRAGRTEYDVTNDGVENEQTKHVLVLEENLTKPSGAKIWINSLYVCAYVVQLSCCKKNNS